MSDQYQSYDLNFPNNIIVASNSFWYTRLQINIILKAINNVYFSATDSRAAGFDTINQSFPAPYSYIPPVRFPDDGGSGPYLTTFDPLFQRIINQLSSALQYKDRLIEKTNVGNVTCSVSSNTTLYVAAFNSFNNAKLEFTRYVNDPRNWFDQSYFERYFRVTWDIIPSQDF